MKKERKCKNHNIDLYKRLEESNSIEDTRYWGLFRFGERIIDSFGKVKIDPKRFRKTTCCDFTDSQLKIINSRKTHYFYPQKFDYMDYNCNIYVSAIHAIKEDWLRIFKGLIERELNRIEKPRQVVPADDYNFQCGITDIDESSAWAFWTNLLNNNRYKEEVDKIVNSLYAQFFHQMASRIEAVTVYVLAKNGKDVKHFDRNALYDFAGPKGTARDFENYKYHDKLYRIWHFIKHNSLSTYLNLKEKYPDVLIDTEFKQGHLASAYVKFSEDLIEELLDGCVEFFKEYCACVYGENYEEAQWNYAMYFTRIVMDKIENIINPFGIYY